MLRLDSPRSIFTTIGANIYYGDANGYHLLDARELRKEISVRYF